MFRYIGMFVVILYNHCLDQLGREGEQQNASQETCLDSIVSNFRDKGLGMGKLHTFFRL